MNKDWIKKCPLGPPGQRRHFSRVAGAVRAGAGQAEAAGEVLQEPRLRAVLPRGLDLLPNILQDHRQRGRLTLYQRL